MTNELEKQFFDTFGIEPKLNSPCEQLLQNKYCNENRGSRDTFFDPFPYCVGFENCAKDYKARVWVYPKIIDRILLKLICLCPDLDEVFFTDIGQLKETLLTSYINTYKYYTEVERLSDCEKELKQQVQSLFKEG